MKRVFLFKYLDIIKLITSKNFQALIEKESKIESMEVDEEKDNNDESQAEENTVSEVEEVKNAEEISDAQKPTSEEDERVEEVSEVQKVTTDFENSEIEDDAKQKSKEIVAEQMEVDAAIADDNEGDQEEGEREEEEEEEPAEVQSVFVDTEAYSVEGPEPENEEIQEQPTELINLEEEVEEIQENESSQTEDEALAQESLEDLLKKKGLQIVDEVVESVTESEDDKLNKNSENEANFDTELEMLDPNCEENSEAPRTNGTSDNPACEIVNDVISEVLNSTNSNMGKNSDLEPISDDNEDFLNSKKLSDESESNVIPEEVVDGEV